MFTNIMFEDFLIKNNVFFSCFLIKTMSLLFQIFLQVFITLLFLGSRWLKSRNLLLSSSDSVVQVFIIIFSLVVWESGVRVAVVLPLTCDNKIIVSGVVGGVTVRVCLLFCSSFYQVHNQENDKCKSYYSCNTSTNNCGFSSFQFWRRIFGSDIEVTFCIASCRQVLLWKSRPGSPWRFTS